MALALLHLLALALLLLALALLHLLALALLLLTLTLLHLLALALLLLALALCVPALSTLFAVQPLCGTDLVGILLAAVLPTVCIQLGKLVRGRK